MPRWSWPPSRKTCSRPQTGSPSTRKPPQSHSPKPRHPSVRRTRRGARWAADILLQPKAMASCRGLYLRIHGTNAPRTIGTAVSNGCARLINPHVIDLYDRVSKGARVVLYKKANAGPSHS
ncbi:L,D-transpeptidase [Profundibacter sp.]|uniref:L,D-transpeptidase n=1 Tax=Profundibacter sp. TaxID=3101071 RepID=UPI003D0FCFD3